MGNILAFACTTDAELMRLRTVCMQLYYLPFCMPYGPNALRGLSDLLAGLSLKPPSGKQKAQVMLRFSSNLFPKSQNECYNLGIGRTIS